jgi:hypothetical protein
MSHGVTRSRPSHARIAALTALALVAASLLSSAHEAAVQHVVCAAHGELTHAAGGSPAHDATIAPAGTTAVDEHAHCTLTSAMREAKPAPRAPAIAAASVASPAPRTPAIAAAAPRTSPVYRSAPKTSPPV